MYYSEKVISGILHFRTTPDGEWKPFTLEGLTQRLTEAVERFRDGITTDPRAGLRRCAVQDCGEAFFHEWTRDADGDPCAIIEYDDGQVQVDLAHHIKFIDIPEAQEC